MAHRQQILLDRKESGLDDSLDSLTGLAAMGYQKAPRPSLLKIMTPAYSHDSDDSDRESIKSDDHILMQEENAHIFEKVDEGSLKAMTLPFDGNWLVDMPSTPEESTRKRLNSASSFNSTPDGVSRRKSLDGKGNREGESASTKAQKDGDNLYVSPTKRLSLHFDKQWSASLSTITGGGSSDADSLTSSRSNRRKEILFMSLNNLHYDFQERKDREDFPTIEKDAALLENILDSDTFDRQSTFMIFVSRTSSPLSNTDITISDTAFLSSKGKENKAEFRILINALDMAWKRYAPHMNKAYVYIDTFCDDREDFNLQDIIQLCDCVLTPIHEPKPTPPSSPRQRSGSTTRLIDVQLDDLSNEENSTWSYIEDLSYSKPNILAQYCDYQAKPFIGSDQKPNPEKDPEAYMNQLWARLTMLACASVPLMETRDELYQAVPSGTMVDNPDGTQSPAPKTIEERINYRAKKFKFELAMACMHKLRPHFVYGSKEDSGTQLLLQLPFMSAMYKDQYDVLKGQASTSTELKYASRLLYSLTYKRESDLEYYRGAYKDGQKHGYGVYVSKKDGSVYEGTWSHDLQHGTNCKLTLSNDQGVIEADYVDGCISGFVTYTNFEKQVYYGEMNSDYQRHGNGRLQYVNGDYYEGAFENNLRHGKGRIVFNEGDEFIGYFLNDKANAFGTYNHADGGSFEGYYRNNRRHGEGTFISSDGSVTTCLFENGKKQGESVTVYTDGTKFVCNFVDGKPESGKQSFTDTREGGDGSFVVHNRGQDTPPPAFTPPPKRKQQN
jgi:hypothetical protein